MAPTLPVAYAVQAAKHGVSVLDCNQRKSPWNYFREYCDLNLGWICFRCLQSHIPTTFSRFRMMRERSACYRNLATIASMNVSALSRSLKSQSLLLSSPRSNWQLYLDRSVSATRRDAFADWNRSSTVLRISPRLARARLPQLLQHSPWHGGDIKIGKSRARLVSILTNSAQLARSSARSWRHQTRYSLQLHTIM